MIWVMIWVRSVEHLMWFIHVYPRSKIQRYPKYVGDIRVCVCFSQKPKSLQQNFVGYELIWIAEALVCLTIWVYLGAPKVLVEFDLRKASISAFHLSHCTGDCNSATPLLLHSIVLMLKIRRCKMLQALNACITFPRVKKCHGYLMNLIFLHYSGTATPLNFY